MKTVSGQILSEVDMSQPFVTFRLVDDDAVSMDFIQRLRRYNKARFAKMAVSLANGFILDFRGNDASAWRPTPQQLLCRHRRCRRPQFPQTIFDVTEKHFRMHKRLPTITDGREPAFVQRFTGSNDTGENRKLKGSADLSSERWSSNCSLMGSKFLSDRCDVGERLALRCGSSGALAGFPSCLVFGWPRVIQITTTYAESPSMHLPRAAGLGRISLSNTTRHPACRAAAAVL